MRKWLAMLRLKPGLARPLAVTAALLGVGAGAFCLGRHGALPQAEGQQSAAPLPVTHVTSTPNQSTANYTQRMVAQIYDNIPISREELGEYLIARYGAERVEFLVNRKIVEMQCRAKGVVVEDHEVDEQLRRDITSFGPGMRLEDFVNQVLKRFNKSLYEWKEDVIRPKLAMTKLVRPTIVVTLTDVEQEFEARYGPKVQCRMIVLQKDTPEARRTEIWTRAKNSETAFLEEASKQFIPELASRGGVIPAIHRHFPDKNIEQHAFAMKPGDVSSLIQVPDGTIVILRCEKHLPADVATRIDSVRPALIEELKQRKLAMRIPEVFAQMRQQAQVRVYLNNPNPTHAPVAAAGAKQAVPPPVGN